MDLSEVRKVASLARLSLTESELTTFAQQLTGILDYVQLLDEVDIDGVTPMPHAVDLHNVFREDQQSASLSVHDALSNAPKSDGHYFLFPQILEEKSA